MAAETMISELQEMGREVTIFAPSDRIAFPFQIPLGARASELIRIGLIVPGDYPLTPPSGPCMTPALGHPKGNVHPAPEFGPEWAYWSRPFPNWPATARNASAYLSHIRALFAEL